METKKTKPSKKPLKDKGKQGRPSAMTDEVLTKLQYAYEIGSTDREACLFAGIGMSTLYEYKKFNTAFAEKIDDWKDKPIFISRQAVLQQIQSGDGDLALKYLERKKKDEFAPKSDIGLGVSQELQEALDKVATIFPN